MATSLMTTKKYTVLQLDTLEGIAARNDSTIGQLMKLNRMSSRLIFPGQTLLIPVVIESADGDSVDNQKSPPPPPTTSSPILAKRFPGHVQPIGSVSTISPTSLSDDRRSEDAEPLREEVEREQGGNIDALDECMKKFLKIFVREFTETEGVVSGVLLVTPNCLMFDPDVSHPLVIENGSEKYAMIAPMDAIRSMALFKNDETPIEAGTHSPDDVHHRTSVGDDSEEEEAAEDDGSPFDVAAADHQPRTEMSNSAHRCRTAAVGGTDSKSCTTAVVDLPFQEIEEGTKPRVFKTLSHGMSCINRASGQILQRAQSVGGSGAAMAARLVTGVPKKFVLISSSILGGTNEPSSSLGPSLGIQCSDVVQQKSFATLSQLMRKTAEARQSLDRGEQQAEKVRKLACILPSVEELIPQHRSEGVCTQMPYFLHVIVDRHALDRSTGAKCDFWFSMPQEMAGPFYEFLVRLCPEKYGNELQPDWMASTDRDDQDADSRKSSSFTQRPFVVLDRDDARTFKQSDDSCQLSGPTSSSLTLSHEWEIVSLSEIRRRLSLKDAADVAYHPLPAGCEDSSLLQEDLIRSLIDVLPARTQGYPWLLVYSSELHGFALSTMYRQMASFREDFSSPSLLVVRDTDHHTFGCVVSCRFHISDHFYGSGECLLFSTYPNFRVFRWTGQNTYIVKGSPDSLAIGAGNGVNGLWLDNDFYRGRTERCDTFANDPLTEKTEFFIAGIEAWCFRLN